MPRGAFLARSALRRRQADEGFEQVGGRGGTLDELAGSGPHGVDNRLRLVQVADGKNGGFGHFLVKQFDGAQCQRRILAGNVDQGDVGIRRAHPPRNRIRSSDWETGAGVDGARHTGAVNEHLQYGALLIVRGDDND